MNQSISAIDISGVKAMEGSDQAVIARTFEHLPVGSARRDAQIVHDDYTDDADWVNALGGVKSPPRLGASACVHRAVRRLESGR